MESEMGPFTEFMEIVLASLRRSKVASSFPFTVERRTSPAIFSARTVPFTDDALIPPLTPSISTAPLIALISLKRARRGTMTVNSTLPGFVVEPSPYLVRMLIESRQRGVYRHG